MLPLQGVLGFGVPGLSELGLGRFYGDGLHFAETAKVHTLESWARIA